MTDSDNLIGQLPALKNRINGTWYMYQGRKRYWENKQLKCEHKQKTNMCEECKNNTNIRHKKTKCELKDYENLPVEIEKEIKYILDHIPSRTGRKFKYAMWECQIPECKHQWAATYNKIQQNRGCPKCGGTMKKELKDYESVGIPLGIKYLLKYIPKNTHTELKEFMWECKEGHQFSSEYRTINSGFGCAKCFGNFPKNHQDYIDLGKEMKIYYILPFIPKSTNHTPVDNCWQCIRNLDHKWSAAYRDIRKGNNCPFCRLSKREIRMKKILDDNKMECKRQFKTNNKYNGKYDFYLPIFNILLEVDGEQHFNPLSYYNLKKGFERSRNLDITKTKNAIECGFRIIRLDYKFIDKRTDKEIFEFISYYIKHTEFNFKFSNKDLYKWILDEIKE